MSRMIILTAMHEDMERVTARADAMHAHPHLA